MSKGPSKLNAARGFNYKRWIVVIALVVIFIVANLLVGGKLLTLGNLEIILSHTVFSTLLAWGMSFIFTTGVIDLSLGATMAISANMAAFIALELNLGTIGLIVVAIVMVLVLEHITMRVSQSLMLPPWIAGLSMALIYESFGGMFTKFYATGHALAIPQLPDEMRWLGSFPGAIVLLIVGGVVAYILMEKTSVGINIRAVGDNEQVAAAMGIKKRKIIFIAAAIGAIFIAFAALRNQTYIGRYNVQTNLTSIGSIFYGLATFLLATSFSFVAPLPITVFGSAFVIQSLFNFLTIIGVPTGTGQNVCLGLVVILCGVLANRGKKGVQK